MLGVFVSDCQSHPAPGVQVTVSDRGEALQLVFTMSGPVLDDGPTQLPDGQLGVAPLTPGTHELVATVGEQEVARRSVVIRQGAVTELTLEPTPR